MPTPPTGQRGIPAWLAQRATGVDGLALDDIARYFEIVYKRSISTPSAINTHPDNR